MGLRAGIGVGGGVGARVGIGSGDGEGVAVAVGSGEGVGEWKEDGRGVRKDSTQVSPPPATASPAAPSPRTMVRREMR